MRNIINEQISKKKAINKNKHRIAMFISMLAILIVIGVSWRLKIIGISMTDDASVEEQTPSAAKAEYLSAVNRVPQAGDSIWLDVSGTTWFTDNECYARMYYYNTSGNQVYMDCINAGSNGLWEFVLPSDFNNGREIKFVRKNLAGEYNSTADISLVSGSNYVVYAQDGGAFTTGKWYFGYADTTIYIDTASFGNITDAKITVNGTEYDITKLTPNKDALVFRILESYKILKNTQLTLTYDGKSISFNLNNLSGNLVKLSGGSVDATAGDYVAGSRYIYFDATYSQLKYFSTDSAYCYQNVIPTYGVDNNSRKNVICKATNSLGTITVTMKVVDGYDSYDGQLIYVTNDKIDASYTKFQFMSVGTSDWNNSANTIISSPDDVTQNCFIADTSDTVLYDNSLRGGYWGTFNEDTNTSQTKDAEKDRNAEIVNIGTGTKNTDGGILWVNSSMYDYYTDYELNGNNRDTYSSGALANTDANNNRRYMPFREFNQTLSSAYSNASVKYPIYTGHFQPSILDFGTPYFAGLNDTLNLYGSDKVSNLPNHNFLSLNNSIENKNGDYRSVSSGYYDYATLGIVKSNLINGYPMLEGTTNDIIDPHFDEKFLSGNNSKNAVVGKYYEKVDFPFTRKQIFDEPVNYWWFDSASTSLELKKNSEVEGRYLLDGTAGMVNNNSLNLDSTGKPLESGCETNSNRNKYGFFPLNNGVADNNSSYYNYGFGNKITINFKLNSDGTVQGTDGNFYSSKFRFSGDDDVWVFIDGKLVLDCGGDHGYVAGLIDFGTNSAYVTKAKAAASNNSTYDSSSASQYTINYIASGNNANRIITDNYYYSTSDVISGEHPTNYDTGKTHEMVIYFMERGQWESNLSLAFSMNVVDTLEVSKQVDSTDVNTIFKDYFNSKISFDYNIKNLATHYGEYVSTENSLSDVTFAKNFTGNITFGSNISQGVGEYQTTGKISSYDSHSNVIKWTASGTASDNPTRNRRLISVGSDTGGNINITGRNYLTFGVATEGGKTGQLKDSIYIVVEDASGNKAYGNLTDDVCSGSISAVATWYNLSVNLTKLTGYNLLDTTKIKTISVENDIQTYTFFDNFVFKSFSLLDAGSQKGIKDYGSAKSGNLENATGAEYSIEDIVKTSSSSSGMGTVDENGTFNLTTGKKAIFNEQFRKGSYIQINEILNDAQKALYDTNVTVVNNNTDITEGYTYSTSSSFVLPSNGGNITKSVISDGLNTLLGIDDGRIEKILNTLGTETGANESQYSKNGIEAKPSDANTIVFRSYDSPDSDNSDISISLNYTNKVRTGSLSIEKAELASAPLNVGGKYTFTIKFSNIGGIGLTTESGKAEVTVVIVATKTNTGFTYMLDGSPVAGIPIITGIPVGTEYTVTESTSDDTGIVKNTILVEKSNGDEVRSGEITFTNNTFSGVITYDETLNTGNKDAYTVVNAKKPTTSIIIKKNWYNDAGQIRPDNIYVKLQVSKDNGTTWSDVKNGNYTLQSTESYKKQIDNLDVYDDYLSVDRVKLMYRIVECIKSGDDYYEINNTTYKLNNYEYKQGDVVVADENAADGNSGTATVNNYYIMRYNLPKTGGFGAEKLVYAGFAIMIAGCICYIYLIKGKKGNDYNENEKRNY